MEQYISTEFNTDILTFITSTSISDLLPDLRLTNSILGHDNSNIAGLNTSLEKKIGRQCCRNESY